MSNAQPIRILHFSDFHLNKENEKEASILLSNMLAAIKKIGQQIDLVVFSGDMIDKGGKSYNDISKAFKKFEEIVINVICVGLGISKERFIFTPGNHDIDGEKIDLMADPTINTTYMITEKKVKEFISNQSQFRKYSTRIQSVKNFEQSYYKDLPNVQYTHNLLESNFVYTIHGIKIGVTSLNTVWRCNSDKVNPNPIVLGLDQIINSHSIIDGCTLKLAVAHFEYDFFREWEKTKARNMIAENYNILFTGHVHSTDVHTIDGPKGQRCPHLKSAGTLDNNRYEENEDYKNGFQIITCFPDNYIDINVYYQRNGQFFEQDKNFGNTDTPGLYRWYIHNGTEIAETTHTAATNNTYPYDSLVLKQVLQNKILKIKQEHPSYKLLADNNYIVRPSLYPRIKDEEASLLNAIQKRQKNEKKNHLILEGRGGCGKSIALLNIFTTNESCKDYSIFIPLKDLSYEDTNKNIISYPITYYIKNLYSGWDEAIEQRAQEPWDNAPSLTLLLDGLNEIPSKHYEIVKRDIEKWAKYEGIQLVLTSRPDSRVFDYKLEEGYNRLTLEDSDRYMVLSFLRDMDATPPPTDNAVWKIICNPLMLNLYYKGQKLSNTENLKQGASEGAVVWNYLQYELEKHQSVNTDALAALFYIAPYIAYNMVLERDYYVDSDKFNLWGDLAIQKVWKKKSPQRPLPDWNNHIKPLLTTNFNLFLLQKLTNNDQYELMHQQLRDAMAAIHLMNVIDLNDNVIPPEWKEPIGVFVMNHIADLISDDLAMKIWELNRIHSSDVVATTNVMDMQWRRLKGDFSKLNFSGMDLRNILLLSYCAPDSQKLKLPQVADLMKDVKLSKESFQMKTNNNIGSGRVASLAVTPDGKYLVSGSWDNVLQVWDTTNFRCKYVLRGHKEKITSVAVNNKWCISGSMDETLKVWKRDENRGWENTDTIGYHTKVAGQFKSKSFNNVNTLFITKDDDMCFSGWTDGYVRILRIDQCGKLIFEKQNKIADCENCIFKKCNRNNCKIVSLALTFNKKYCVIRLADDTIIIWEWENPNEQNNKRIIASRSAYVCGLAIHENTCVFSESERINNDTKSKLWFMDVANAQDKNDATELDGYHDHFIGDVAFSPDGKYVVSGSWDETVRIWDMSTKKVHPIPLKDHTREVNAVAISTDGKFIYSGSRDRTIKVWDMETGMPLKTMLAESHNWITVIRVAGKDRCVIGCEDGSIRVWDTKNGICQKVFTTVNGLSTLDTANDGEFCLSGDKEGHVFCWDLDSDTGNRKDFIETDGKVPITSISIEQPYIAIGMQNGKIELWDVVDKSAPKKKCTWEHTKGCVNVVCLKNNKCYSGASDKTVKIWEIGNEEPSQIIQNIKIENEVTSIDVSSNGEYLVFGEKAKNNINNHPSIHIYRPDENGQYQEIYGIDGAMAGKRPVIVLDDKMGHYFCVMQDFNQRKNEEKISGPFIKKHQLSQGEISLCFFGSPGNTKGWVSSFASDEEICYFGTNKGYIGFAKTNKFEKSIRDNNIKNKHFFPYDNKIELSENFKQWPVLMDVDVIGINLSMSNLDEDLKYLLKCNGAIVDYNNAQET